MSSRYAIWLSLVLLPVLLDRSECIRSHARRQYRLTYKLSSYDNYFSLKDDDNVCDNTTGKTEHCDVRVKMWVECSGCEHSSTVYYPSINESYVDTSYLDRLTDGINEENGLSVDAELGQEVIIRLVVEDVDLNGEEIIFDGRKDNDKSLRSALEVCVKPNGSISCENTPKISWYNSYDELVVETVLNVECAPSTCGETCVLPDENFGCHESKVVCLTNKLDSSCELYVGNFPGSFQLVSYKKNRTAVNLTNGCYDVVSVCASAFENQSCTYQQWASTSSDRLDASLLRAGDRVFDANFVTNIRGATYFGRVKFTNFCHGFVRKEEEHGFQVSVYGDTIIRVNGYNKYAVGVFKAGCERNLTGSGLSCFYNNACHVNKCLNGGICLMQLQKLDSDVRQANIYLKEKGVDQHVSVRMDVYTAVCLCDSGFKGTDCEEAEED